MNKVSITSVKYYSFQFHEDGVLLFAILPDGTVERGPKFTTTDEMSLKFWDAIENARRPLPPLKVDA